MTFGYDVDVVSFKKMASQDNLRSHAKDLLEALTDVGPTVDPAQPSTTAPRPIFFVTHSLGGLLCKQALVLASSRDQYQQVFDAFAGIIFIGTPHKGSKQAKLGGRLVSMVDMFRPANKGLVKMLEEQSPELSALDDDFWTLMGGRKRGCRVHCYHESAPMPGLGIIVTSESASRPGVSSSPLEGNHSNMLKFENPQDAGYLKIATKLSTWISDLDSVIEHAAQPAAPQELPAGPIESTAQSNGSATVTTTAAQAEQLSQAEQASRHETVPLTISAAQASSTPQITQAPLPTPPTTSAEQPQGVERYMSSQFNNSFIGKHVPIVNNGGTNTFSF
jgi:hypothetical protein